MKFQTYPKLFPAPPPEADAESVTQATASSVTELPQAPVVQYLNVLLAGAVRARASDIHLEPEANQLRVRWRIDGHLTEAEAPPIEMKEALISRIKVLAKLDISERRIPQDGHIKDINIDPSHQVGFRVSTLPTIHGEKVVLRVLDHDAASLQVDKLGLEASQLAALYKALSQPHGLILVTGPTGSGKTVTLYSCLNRLNNPESNISTVEDPSEIRLPGISQVNINEKAGLSFASVMRSFLRQDPDVIMIGEVRDGETADIAIKAAQTGHLVLSTLHTNDAPSSLSRLVNMGVPAFQVATSVSLICAQRLVRRLCEHCKVPAPTSAQKQKSLGLLDSQQERVFYQAVGCPQCLGGYRGRIGIFQVMPISASIAGAMTQGQSTQVISDLAIQERILTLRQAALRKALSGQTSIEEVLAHTRND